VLNRAVGKTVLINYSPDYSSPAPLRHRTSCDKYIQIKIFPGTVESLGQRQVY